MARGAVEENSPQARGARHTSRAVFQQAEGRGVDGVALPSARYYLAFVASMSK